MYSNKYVMEEGFRLRNESISTGNTFQTLQQNLSLRPANDESVAQLCERADHNISGWMKGYNSRPTIYHQARKS